MNNGDYLLTGTVDTINCGPSNWRQLFAQRYDADLNKKWEFYLDDDIPSLVMDAYVFPDSETDKDEILLVGVEE